MIERIKNRIIIERYRFEKNSEIKKAEKIAVSQGKEKFDVDKYMELKFPNESKAEILSDFHRFPDILLWLKEKYYIKNPEIKTIPDFIEWLEIQDEIR